VLSRLIIDNTVGSFSGNFILTQFNSFMSSAKRKRVCLLLCSDDFGAPERGTRIVEGNPTEACILLGIEIEGSEHLPEVVEKAVYDFFPGWGSGLDFANTCS
jgi:hypothetical protein